MNTGTARALVAPLCGDFQHFRHMGRSHPFIFVSATGISAVSPRPFLILHLSNLSYTPEYDVLVHEKLPGIPT